MKRAMLNLAAGLVGMALGWAVVAHPQAAAFTPTTVTWNATACPSGVYTITTMAQSLQNGATFVETSSRVRLPASTFVQEFSNLPAGPYSVTASVRREDGVVFSASTQLVTGQSGRPGSGHVTPVAPGPVSGVSGHRRQPSGQSSYAAPAGGGGASVQAAATEAPVATEPIITGPAVAWEERFLLEVRRFLDRTGNDADWQRLEILDTDGDGVIDVAAIQLATGDVYVWSVRRR